MLHDPALLDRLSALPTERFAGAVFRATRWNLDPLAPSTSGGRWMPGGDAAVLYTSLEREGALAEIAFHWSQFTPRPSKPARLHRLSVAAGRTLRLVRAQLDDLGVGTAQYHDVNYTRTQVIGSAVAFLGCDGLVVPSARWRCDNLILFTDTLALDHANTLEVSETEAVDWLAWGKDNGVIDG